MNDETTEKMLSLIRTVQGTVNGINAMTELCTISLTELEKLARQSDLDYRPASGAIAECRDPGIEIPNFQGIPYEDVADGKFPYKEASKG